MQSASVELPDIHAAFGRVMHAVAAFDVILVELIALNAPPRPAGTTFDQAWDEVDDLFYSHSSGQLAARVKPLLDDELFDRVKGLVNIRNFLAHHYFRERRAFVDSAERRPAMLHELRTYFDDFERLARALEIIADDRRRT